MDILYEHTLEMQRLSTEEQLTKVGLDASFLNKETATTIDTKIMQLEQSYGMITTDSLSSSEERILALEDVMAHMMYQWALSE